MPNYEDAAKKFGWEKVGSKWVNKVHPGKTYYNAREIYRDMIPESHKRPDSITPKQPEPLKVEPTKAIEPEPNVYYPPGHPLGDDIDGPKMLGEIQAVVRKPGRPRKADHA